MQGLRYKEQGTDAESEIFASSRQHRESAFHFQHREEEEEMIKRGEDVDRLRIKDRSEFRAVVSLDRR